MRDSDYIRTFDSLAMSDVPVVGGKTASLGELHRLLRAGPIQTPDGFAVTAQAYRDALAQADAGPRLTELMAGVDVGDVADLARRGAEARRIVYEATDWAPLKRQILAAFQRLSDRSGGGLSVAVRSSATAEDLPHASFAGQHDSFLHIRDDAALIEACRRCFASLFTDRAISYRVHNGFDHMKVALSVAVMQMVRSDAASSGVVFTLDTESGFRDVIFVTGAYGLGENVVQGRVDPDEWYVHKPTFRKGVRAVLKRSLGGKQTRICWKKGGGDLRTAPVSRRDRERFCLTDEEVLALTDVAIRIEDHYSKRAGRPMPMDIEWAKDADDGGLYIVQARPETVASQRGAEIETFRLKGSGEILVRGKSIGERIASGRVRVVRGPEELKAFQPGEVLVAEATNPDWEPVLKTAAAVVTDRGGRTCHAAIVARELGVPAVVGAGDATRRLANGRLVTVSCAEGETGHVYAGDIPFDVERLDAAALPRPETHVMLNLAHPDLAFRFAQLPSDGVGLARLEFIIGEQIRMHPMAAAHPDRITSARSRTAVARLAKGYPTPRDYFLARLTEGAGVIAAAFYPRPVIVRLSDFKTNEYARLTGGRDFEPIEENPMLGFRGASRYAHPLYADGFALECEALRRVREDLGLTNLKVMVPFCRRVGEAERVLDAMAANGLKRGENGLEVYVMCEIPNNVVQIDAFAKLFDGFSIGSNDLTQLTLGVDRDSETVAFDFDERDPGVLEMLRQAVAGAHRNGRHVGICGEAPATYPEVARFLTEQGVDSMSVNPHSLARTLSVVFDAEAAAGRKSARGSRIIPEPAHA
jgi:pyruvate,water dikinase